MKNESDFKIDSAKNKIIIEEIDNNFSHNRKVIYFGIALLGFLLALYPLLAMKLTGVIIVIFALLLYFADKQFV